MSLPSYNPLIQASASTTITESIAQSIAFLT
jgi:hypothetical protein